jgi:hypothetical protein
MCLPCGASRLCARVLSDSLSLAPPLAGARARALALDLSLSRTCSLSCARCRSLLAEWGLHGHVTQGRLTPIEDYEARIRAIEVTIYPDSEIAQRTLTSAILGA